MKTEHLLIGLAAVTVIVVVLMLAGVIPGIVTDADITKPAATGMT